MDQRIEHAQTLLWEITRLREYGLHRATLHKLIEMARIHEQRAIDLLDGRDADGWADLYAAITAWGEAGCQGDAQRLIVAGRRRSADFSSGRENIDRQLDELADWLDALHVIPFLGDFARSLPPIIPLEVLR